MTKWEKLQAVMAGRETDGRPVSIWRHFYSQETTPEGLTAAMLDFQKAHDWDFMKVNPRAGYHDEAWGAEYHQPDGPDAKPQRTGAVVKETADWAKIKPVPPDEGPLGEHIKVLEMIRDGLTDDTPFIMTVFTPLSVAGRLADSPEKLLAQIDSDPAAVRKGLEAITETFVNFSKACIKAGAAGLFFATTDWATTDCITTDQYDEWSRPYDLKVLKTVADARFNMLHVCRANNMLDHLLDYPVHAFNWDAAHPTNPSLEQIWGKTDKTVIGGIATDTMLNSTPEMIHTQAQAAACGVGRGRFILGAGCTFDPEVPEENVKAVKEAAKGL